MLPAEVMRRKERKDLTLPSDLVDNIPRTITSESAEYDCLNLIGSVSVFFVHIFRMNCKCNRTLLYHCWSVRGEPKKT